MSEIEITIEPEIQIDRGQAEGDSSPGHGGQGKQASEDVKIEITLGDDKPGKSQGKEKQRHSSMKPKEKRPFNKQLQLIQLQQQENSIEIDRLRNRISEEIDKKYGLQEQLSELISEQMCHKAKHKRQWNEKNEMHSKLGASKELIDEIQNRIAQNQAKLQRLQEQFKTRRPTVEFFQNKINQLEEVREHTPLSKQDEKKNKDEQARLWQLIGQIDRYKVLYIENEHWYERLKELKQDKREAIEKIQKFNEENKDIKFEKSEMIGQLKQKINEITDAVERMQQLLKEKELRRRELNMQYKVEAGQQNDGVASHAK